MNLTSIEWTKRPGTTGMTWNPIHAKRVGQDGNAYGKTGNFCTRISPGCTNCYASSINQRWGNGLEYIVPNLRQVGFYIDKHELLAPWRRKKPSTIFVGDMFDLFHESIPFEMIVSVLHAMAGAKQHTFQVLTKRTERMQKIISAIMYRPHPHIWFGVSVEDQQRADERIPHLLNTPAAIRFVSVEPLLEPIELIGWNDCDGVMIPWLRGFAGCDPPIPALDWVIVGGESGKGARPFNMAWGADLLRQCRIADVAAFMKQCGSNPLAIKFKDSKGGDPAEWPEHLRVREWPR